MLKVKELMTTNVISVKKDTPLSAALEYLERHNISGLPVIRDDHTLAGIITEKDVLQFFYREGDLTHKKVGQYMTSSVMALEEDDDLMNACVCLENHYIRRMPVTRDGKLTGVISRRDIIKYVLWTKCGKVDTEQQIASAK